MSVIDRIQGLQANGFYGSKGVSGRIPEGYTLLEKHFWRKVLRADRAWEDGTASGIELREWEKDDWTYHAKGACHAIFSLSHTRKLILAQVYGTAQHHPPRPTSRSLARPTSTRAPPTSTQSSPF